MPGAEPTLPPQASPARCDPVRGRAPYREPTAGVRGPRVPSARGPSTPTTPPCPEGSSLPRCLPQAAAAGRSVPWRPGAAPRLRPRGRARTGATSGRFHPFLIPRQAGGAGRAAPHRAPHRGHLPEASSSSEGAAAAASSLPRHLPAAPCGRSASVRGRGPGWSGSCCGRCSTTTAPGCWRCSGPSSTTTPTSAGCCRRRGQPPSRPAGERPARRPCGEGLGGPGGALRDPQRGLQRVLRGSRGRPQRPQRLVVPRRSEVTGLEADIQRFIAQKADLLFAQSWQPNGPIAENIEEDDGEGRG